MKIIKKFFLNIWKVIDKIIIFPITKLIYRITSRFENSSKKIENWLSTSNTLLFISLFLAIVTFIIIDQKIIVFNDNTAEVLKEQVVKSIYNEEAYVVEGLPETVDVTLIGSKTDLYIAKQSSSHDVTVDLSGLKPGTHKVNINYNQNVGKIDYMVNPSTVTVIIYQKVSKTMTLSVDLINQDKLDQKLTIDDINYETDKVVIKGAEHQLNEVASVKAILDIDELSEQKSGNLTVKDVPLKAYNKSGDVVDVEIVPAKIDVDLKISSPNKEVPIKIIPEGEVSFGKAISSISQSETKVTVYGDQDALKDITYIPVNVDVTDLKENKEYKLELNKPVGTRSLSINNITVKITLDSVTNKDFKDIDIESKNLADGYSVQGVDENSTKVTVTVKGVENVIKNINESDISAYIDLSGYTEGEYEVPVNVEGIEVKASYVSKTKKVKIKIVKD
ncbi:MAG: hypothetical protein J6K21_03895 [Bacilli bacterium]|nr:hypothetical protein [Bacilli bacterium]